MLLEKNQCVIWLFRIFIAEPVKKLYKKKAHNMLDLICLLEKMRIQQVRARNLFQFYLFILHIQFFKSEAKKNYTNLAKKN